MVLAVYKTMETQQQRINRAIKNKEMRQDKTSQSILISWAINNAVHTLPEKGKENWDATKFQIEARYNYFIELYRSWMIDNMLTIEKEEAKEDKAREEVERDVGHTGE